jgi:hypothetical protein
LKRQPEIGHRIRGAGIDLKRLREKAERLDHVTALEVEHSKQMQRIEVFGPVFQNPGAQPFGPVEIALLERTESLTLQARQVRHPPGCFL